jgi:D-aspartate ligase
VPRELPVAIVFNCHYNGLSMIQELGLHGIPCVAMDSKRLIGTFSRYARYVRCPNPAENESEFVDFLFDFCATQKLKPVLFPTNDEWAVAVSRNKDRLAEVAVPCVADWPAIETVIEKDRFYEIARQRSYPTPATWTLQEAHRLSEDAYPIVAKPRFRRNASDGELVAMLENMDRLRLTVLHGERDLARFRQLEQSALPHLLFQEFVHGVSDRMYTVGLYADRNNEVQAVFTGKKVRGYPADIGDCTVGEVREVPDELVEQSIKVVRDLELSGIMEFEFKQDVRTGNYRLIEVNPRSWSWIGITPTCGVNLPLIAYQDLALGQSTADPYRRAAKRDGTVRYYRVIPDFLNSTIRYRRDYPQWHRTPRSWWKELRGTPEVVLAEFHARDYLVGLVAVIAEARSLVLRLLGTRTGP